MSESEQTVGLWDRDCGLCANAMRWSITRDRAGAIRWEAFQVSEDPRITPELRTACQRSLHVIMPDGQILAAGKAALYVLSVSGQPTVAALLGLRIFSPIIEIGYRLIAKNRLLFSRIFFPRSKAEACEVPRKP
ncbi:MAG: DCC1-like thiol-disulfide oxidoreductase family protein [Chthonomonadales bacterium]